MSAHKPWQARLSGLAILLLTASAVQAAGFTSEAEALREFSWTHRPIVFSDDGAWRISQNARGELVRERNDGQAAPAQRLPLNQRVHAMASRGAAQQVWLMLTPTCLLQADFGANPPRLKPMQDQNCPHGKEPLNDALPDFQLGRLALSPDGRWLATPHPLDTSALQVLELPSLKRRWSLPAGGRALALHFEDGGRRLRVVDAVLGEQWEDIADPSWLQLSRWDLETGALWTEGGRAGAFQHAWQYEQAGTATHHIWLDDKGVQALDLRSCPSRSSPWPLPKGWEAWALSADPQGRWLAVAAGRAGQQRVFWLEGHSGQLLAESPWPLAKGQQAAGLQAFAGGLLLRQGSAVAREGVQYDHNPWRLGLWQRLALPAAVAALPPVAVQASACAAAPLRADLEPWSDEAPDARLPARSNSSPLKPLWQAALGDAPPPRCPARPELEDWEPDRPPRRWGVDPEGRLWVDQGATLQQLDARDGRALARWPTPRSATVCSTPSFARAQFLNWQGDTLSLRPFAAQPEPKARQWVEQRPGWRVERAVWLGDRVLARWVRGEQAEQRLYEADAEGHWTLRSQRRGRMEEGRGWFEDDDGNTSAVGWHRLLSAPLTPETVEREERGVREPALRWQLGPFGSVLASRAGRLLLWDGVAGLGPELDALQLARIREPGARVLRDLGEGRALTQAGPQLGLYRMGDGRPAQLWRPPTGQEDPLVEDGWWWAGPGLLLVQRNGQLEAVRPPH